MHAYVHCSTIHNSKDMKSTQMPLNDRQDKENVVPVHHGILCSHKKNEIMFCRDTDKAGSHYPQQTNMGTENKIPCIFTNKRKLNNENPWTQGGEQHTLGSLRGGLGGERA